jgi:hypothetical protein
MTDLGGIKSELQQFWELTAQVSSFAVEWGKALF